MKFKYENLIYIYIYIKFLFLFVYILVKVISVLLSFIVLMIEMCFLDEGEISLLVRFNKYVCCKYIYRGYGNYKLFKGILFFVIDGI